MIAYIPTVDLCKQAVQVNTDTASFYVLAPEQLKRLIEEGQWLQTYFQGKYPEADFIVRQHNGAVFHTGADGLWEVFIPDTVREYGMLPKPKRVAARYLGQLAT